MDASGEHGAYVERDRVGPSVRRGFDGRQPALAHAVSGIRGNLMVPSGVLDYVGCLLLLLRGVDVGFF